MVPVLVGLDGDLILMQQQGMLASAELQVAQELKWTIRMEEILHFTKTMLLQEE